LIDIGGTNVRTATATIGSSSLVNPVKKKHNQIFSIDALINDFLKDDLSIKHLVFSVAGPKINSYISMTNAELKIDKNYILKNFKLDSCHILNDWESIAHSLAITKNHEIDIINKGKIFNDTALVVGPGTGLGAALVIRDDIILPTELGNSSIHIPEIFQEFISTNKNDFRNVESIFSGKGLTKIFFSISGIKKNPEEIVATYESDNFSKQSIDIFLISIAQLLSELALIYMPGKGIYLSGALIRSLIKFLNFDSFIKNFLENKKPPHKEILKQTRIALQNKEMACLYGCLNFINKFNQNIEKS
tara:strand:+ start:119 stop:1030 length:912 start_codon:yes stop_codon:yes gene_type:complete